MAIPGEYYSALLTGLVHEKNTTWTATTGRAGNKNMSLGENGSRMNDFGRPLGPKGFFEITNFVISYTDAKKGDDGK